MLQHPYQLESKHLTRIVADTILVYDVTMKIERGEVVAIVGQSGAGKSSLLRLLNRLDEPTSGSIHFEGRDITEIPPRELRRRIGMIMQTPYLFPGTVAENVSFGPKQRGQVMPTAEIDQFLARVGLSNFGNKSVDKLSGGEAQRVALARALANNPDVLLLDEPTSALDEKNKEGVETLLKEIIQEESLTCLLVTHDLAQAARMANRVLLMEDGRDGCETSKIGALTASFSS